MHPAAGLQPYQARKWVYRHLRNAWFIRDEHYRLDSSGKFLWAVGAGSAG